MREPLLGDPGAQPPVGQAPAAGVAGGDGSGRSAAPELRAALWEAAAREAVRQGALRFWQHAMAARQRANHEASRRLRLLEEEARAAAEAGTCPMQQLCAAGCPSRMLSPRRRVIAIRG